MQEIFSGTSQFKKTNTESVINAALGNLDEIADLKGLSQQVGLGLHQESVPIYMYMNLYIVYILYIYLQIYTYMYT
jgi:hypothetical protein